MRTAAVVLIASVLLTGCSSPSSSSSVPDASPSAAPLPAETDFAEGTCRVAAPDVLAVARALPRLGDGGEVAADVRDELRVAQDRVFALAETAEPEVKTALDGLVTDLAIVRIRADSNTYETPLGDGLREAYEDVVEVCTGSAPPAS
ncbi:MAG: hypothetical protein JWN08_1574 [Frankiales bacterium]|nr:hypothetical protein [Frankiales bacterium]